MQAKVRVEIKSVSTSWLDGVFGVLLLSLLISLHKQSGAMLVWCIAFSMFISAVSFAVYRSTLQKITGIVFDPVGSYVVLNHQKIYIDTVKLSFLSDYCVVFTLRLDESVGRRPFSINRLPICLFRIEPNWCVFRTNTDFHSVFVAFKTGYIVKLVNR